ncbi:hypothetical protein [Ammonifex thiophilus]|uniref:hypothetical protein n=1 Tax=Ammonifex thiophilus TaxID=444093 RepID=UPI001069AE57|nr:hypothetical protein [Ammonifex thiophilus]
MLFVSLALLLLHPGGARASVVESAYGPIIYAWSDAVAVVGDRVLPELSVVRPSPETLSTAENGRWASDADAGAWSPGVVERTDALFGELASLGVPREALGGLRACVLPAFSLRLPGQACGSAWGAAGAYFPGTGPPLVAVAGLGLDPERVLLHEIGHCLADRLLGTAGYDWSCINGKGREYLQLRGYPASRPLGLRGQVGLPHDCRVAEWFAEDFLAWYASRTGRAWGVFSWDPEYRAPGEEVFAWFDGLFARRRW